MKRPARRGGVLLALAAGSIAASGPGIAVTKHNLSVTGPGPVRAADETEICVFCHAAHPTGTAAVPLWNHATDGTVAYEAYDSPLTAGTGSRVDGASLLCLSCHDGTIAVGAVGGPERGGGGRRIIPVQRTDAAGRLRATDPAYLGTDLSGDHPVSVVQEAAARTRSVRARTWLRDPAPLASGAVVDADGKVQCTSCHDAHSDPAALGADVPPFWRGDTFSVVCEACHVAPVADAGHGDPVLLPDGCGSCHVGHGLPGEPLMADHEEENCLSCHGGPANRDEAARDGRLADRADPVRVDDLFLRPYTHPVFTSSGEHALGEDLTVVGARTPRHVECADCHPAHAARTTTGPRAPGWDLARPTLDGRPEFELCFDCHGATANLPFGETDKQREFDPANASYHPILAPARGQSASLTGGWSTGDVLDCSDCHGADGGDPRRGPHGSRNAYLLKGNYVVRDGADDTEATYEACYACHARGDVLSDDTFAGHSQHVVTAKIACYTCHDSHGSPDGPGLVRFNKDPRNGTVAPSSSGRLAYDGTTGACYLSCHGVDHDPLVYP